MLLIKLWGGRVPTKLQRFYFSARCKHGKYEGCDDEHATWAALRLFIISQGKPVGLTWNLKRLVREAKKGARA